MTDTIEKMVDDSIAQISYFIRRLPPVKAKLSSFTFPNISITDLRQTGGGLKYATVDIDVKKEPVIYKQDGKYKEFKILHEYWAWAVKRQLKREGMLNTVKAASLVEFRDNIIDNYASQDKETVDNLTGIIDETIEALQQAREQENETDMYHVPPNALRELDPVLKNASSIRIAKLVSELMFNPENYEKLKQLKLKGEPCSFRMLKEILYE